MGNSPPSPWITWSWSREGNCHLSLELQQIGQLSSLLVQFKDVIDDKPGRSTVVEHTIRLVPGARRVRQTPYRLHPEKQRAVSTEIASLLEDEIIEETNSP